MNDLRYPIGKFARIYLSLRVRAMMRMAVRDESAAASPSSGKKSILPKARVARG